MYNLLRLIKSSLNKFLLRLKDSQIGHMPESYNQMSTVDHRSSLSKRNIIFSVFNSVTETVNCKQLISHLAAILLIEDKMALNVSSSSLVEIVKAL